MKEVHVYDPAQSCSVAGCMRRRHAQGKCLAHYKRDLRGSERGPALLKRGANPSKERFSVRPMPDTLVQLREESESSRSSVGELLERIIKEWAENRRESLALLGKKE